MRGIFVTGTGTEVGKSIVAAAVCAALAARGERVAAFKPAVTGLHEPSGDWPADHELLAGAASAGQSPADLAALAEIPGVGPAKLERYGDDVLRIVATAPPAAATPRRSP